MKRLFSGFCSLLLVVSLLTCVSQGSSPKEPIGKMHVDSAKSSYGRGLILDPEKYDSAPLIESDGTRGSGGRPGLVLPKTVSLKEYAPIPGQQGNIGSCFAWASAYAAWTIMESQSLNRTDKFLSTKMAGSALLLYHGVREMTGAPAGKDGASLLDTVTAMAQMGVYRQTLVDEKILANTINPADLNNNSIPPISGFGILFYSNAKPEYRVEQVKKSLFAGNPVIIGAFLPDSFKNAKDIWIPENGDKAEPENGHAVCVVSYDDEKYGGAFEIMNSWGEEWGNGGYTWISYDTFGQWVDQAWNITGDISYYSEASECIAKAGVNTKEQNEILQVRLSEDGIYRLTSTVKNGTQLRLNIEGVNSTDNRPVYSYAFYTDAQNDRAVKINTNEWINTGNTVKPENLVILYSRAELKIDSLIDSFGKSSGNTATRLKNILGELLVPVNNSKYEYDSMQVTADLMKEGSVVGMILSVNYDTAAKPVKDMIQIKGSSFTMGSPSSEKWHQGDEKQRKVTLGDYYIGSTEVTIGEFRSFIKSTGYKTAAEKKNKSVYFDFATAKNAEREGLNWKNAIFTQEDSHPVVHISWYDAAEYCNWLSRQEGFTPAYVITAHTVQLDASANGYRLPTEAEWEYACRAGTNTPFNTGNTITPDLANYRESSLHKTTPVKKYAPNKWGLYDAHGNVYEWCWDTYESGMQNIRSGAWFVDPPAIRSAYRNAAQPEYTGNFVGFRVARSAGKEYAPN